MASRGNWRERTTEKDYERSKFDERYERGYGNRNRYKSGGSHDDEEGEAIKSASKLIKEEMVEHMAAKRTCSEKKEITFGLFVVYN